MKAIGTTPSAPTAPVTSDLLGSPSGTRSGRNPHEVATEFEALLLRSMVESMRKTTTAEDEQPGGQLVEHLIDDALAGHLAKSGGIGLASFVGDEVVEPQVVSEFTVSPSDPAGLRGGPHTPALDPATAPLPTGSTEGRLDLERWARNGLVTRPVTESTSPEPNEIAPLKP